MTAEELKEIVAQDENAKVDFKREWYKSATKNELKSEFVKDMFALTNGDIHSVDKTAYLIVGVIDGTKEIYDFDSTEIPRSLDKLKKELLELLNNYAQPEFLSLEIEWIELEESKDVLVLSVLPHGRLISLSRDLKLKKGTDKRGTVYYRIGENIRVASADVIKDFEKAFSIGIKTIKNIQVKTYLETVNNTGVMNFG